MLLQGFQISIVPVFAVALTNISDIFYAPGKSDIPLPLTRSFFHRKGLHPLHNWWNSGSPTPRSYISYSVFQGFLITSAYDDQSVPLFPSTSPYIPSTSRSRFSLRHFRSSENTDIYHTLERMQFLSWISLSITRRSSAKNGSVVEESVLVIRILMYQVFSLLRGNTSFSDSGPPHLAHNSSRWLFSISYPGVRKQNIYNWDYSKL